MKILSIETSCDETAICILELNDDSSITLLGNALSSQIDIHAQYGGVFPALAKRAHAEKIVPMLIESLSQSELLIPSHITIEVEKLSFLDEKETTLKSHLVPFFEQYNTPDIDYIAVTVGPGLEPALWVGVNTARALSVIWNIPVIPINHMEGHIVTAIIEPFEEELLSVRMAEPARKTEDVLKEVVRKKYVFAETAFPILSLLVSGGHTELVVAEAYAQYKKIGSTRDDAVGEAFDKVARMLGLPYPGGPAVSKLAAVFRETNRQNPFTMPRPMMHSGDYDFSFSGIKTAMLYTIRDLTNQNIREIIDDEKQALACAFEDAVVEVLVHKTLKAIYEYNIQTFIVGGGVAGNIFLRNALKERIGAKFPHVTLLFPEPWLATDNAVMIGVAAMAQVLSGQIKTASSEMLKADGNLSL